MEDEYLKRYDILTVRNKLSEIVDPGTYKTAGMFYTNSDRYDKTFDKTEKTEKTSQNLTQNLTGNVSKVAIQLKDEEDPRKRAGSKDSKESGESAGGVSDMSIRARLKTVIFSKKHRKSAHLPVKTDMAISKDLLWVSMIDCQKLKIDHTLNKNEFGLFEILMVAIFLSIVNLPEEADLILQQVQEHFEGRDVNDVAILVTLMICRIKNMSKLKSSKQLAGLVSNLENFIADKMILNEFLNIDLYSLKSRMNYCLNNFDQSFRYITEGLLASENLMDSKETYLNHFLLMVVRSLYNLKKYHHAYKILILQSSKKMLKAGKQTNGGVHDEFWLEKECFMVKLLFKLKKYRKAASHFEHISSTFIKDKKEQIILNHAGLVVELYCYGVLTSLRLENTSRALHIYNDLFGAIEYNWEEQKMFYGIAACLKGIILLSKDLNLKLVSRSASLANRMSKGVVLESNESCNVLMFKLMIKLYLALGKHSEVETVSSSCIKIIERGYSPFHLQTVDFYVFKVESLMARQRYTEAHVIIDQMSRHFDMVEEYLSDKQTLDLMRINFSVMMDLGMFDSIEDFLNKRREKCNRRGVTFRLQPIVTMIEKAEEIIGKNEPLIIDDELDSNRSGHPATSQKKLLLTLDAFNIKYNMKKRDYKAAVSNVKALLEDQDNMTKFMDDFSLLLTCAKVVVKGAKHQIGSFSEAVVIINELVDSVNATNDFASKVRGMHEVAMYLFYTGEHQKSLEYLFQAMCYLETRVVADQLSTAWEVLGLKVRSLSHISKFAETEGISSVSRNLIDYMNTSLRVALDEFEELDSKSKSFDSRRRIKILLRLATAFARNNETDIAHDLIDRCRAKIIEVNNGEFCYLKLTIQKIYTKILMTLGTYDDALDEAESALNKASSLSDRDNNRFVRAKLVALIKDIAEKGNMRLEKANLDDSELEESEPVVIEEPA